MVSNNHGLTKFHVVWAYPPSLSYNLWFCVCCMFVTDHIWYEGGCPRAFGRLETWLRGGRAKHGVYRVAVVMVAMARTCTCNCQLRCGSACRRQENVAFCFKPLEGCNFRSD